MCPSGKTTLGEVRSPRRARSPSRRLLMLAKVLKRPTRLAGLTRQLLISASQRAELSTRTTNLCSIAGVISIGPLHRVKALTHSVDRLAATPNSRSSSSSRGVGSRSLIAIAHRNTTVGRATTPMTTKEC